MLYLIGLGLADETDISVKGLEIVRRASRVYLEAYTAILLVDAGRLEAFYGRPVIVAARELVESNSDVILDNADTEDVAFLVVGDPFSATTHTDLLLRARARHIPTQTLPNASILTAIGATGLSLYTFGQTVSIPLFTDTWRPTSFLPRCAENARLGLHTLLLLDIKVREPDLDRLAREGRYVYAPPRYMTAAEAVGQVLEVGEKAMEREEEKPKPPEAASLAEINGDRATARDDEIPWPLRPHAAVFAPDRLAVAAARVGSTAQQFVAGTLAQLRTADLGPPLHSVVLLGWRAHDVEREALRGYTLDVDTFDRVWERDYAGMAKIMTEER